MIDIKELRRGNIIYLNGKKCVVDSDQIAFMEKCASLGIGLDATPVKLTEEILKEIGFSFDFDQTPDKVFSMDDVKLYHNDSEGFHLYHQGVKLGKGFFYLHQLQNLMFCLFGKEITISFH